MSLFKHALRRMSSGRQSGFVPLQPSCSASNQRLQAHIVNYADDFVILGHRKAAEAQAQMAKMMEKLKLEVNQKKTRICHVPEESFDFLGYTLGQCYRVKTGQAYIGTKPSKKRVLKLFESISQKTQREANGRETGEMIGELNASSFMI